MLSEVKPSLQFSIGAITQFMKASHSKLTAKCEIISAEFNDALNNPDLQTLETLIGSESFPDNGSEMAALLLSEPASAMASAWETTYGFKSVWQDTCQAIEAVKQANQ